MIGSYLRTIAQREVVFTCTICAVICRREQYPGPTPRYCSSRLTPPVQSRSRLGTDRPRAPPDNDSSDIRLPAPARPRGIVCLDRSPRQRGPCDKTLVCRPLDSHGYVTYNVINT